MSPDILSLFGQFGPLGLMIGYLVWRESVSNSKRETLQKERTESDKALAVALTALTVTIQHLEQRIK